LHRSILAGGAAVSQPGGPSVSVGRPLGRIEDADLLCGRSRFGDDLAMRVGTLHAVILRSPYAHAELLAVDMEAALAVPGVAAIVTGEDAKRWTRPFIAAVKAPVEHWCLAVD
jgi:2-furoyl-CoA dehydrogenase large subunit